jgi:hypothetical protein
VNRFYVHTYERTDGKRTVVNQPLGEIRMPISDDIKDADFRRFRVLQDGNDEFLKNFWLAFIYVGQGILYKKPLVEIFLLCGDIKDADF